MIELLDRINSELGHIRDAEAEARVQWSLAMGATGEERAKCLERHYAYLDRASDARRRLREIGVLA